MKTHIVAMGGGGLNGPIGGPSPILLYYLGLTGKKHPRVCFLPTAAADSKESIQNFTGMLHGLGATVDYLQLFHPPTWDLEGFLLGFDAIFVSGGHTRNMLALWREWEVDKILVKAWKRGIVLGGGSAGAICWYDEGCTDSVTDGFDPLYNCLSMVPGSFCPHYGHARGRWRGAYLAMIKSGQLGPGWAVTDRAALHYVNGKLAHRIVESADAAIYWVEKNKAGEAVERKEAVEMLEGPGLKLEPAALVKRRRQAPQRAPRKRGR